MQVPDSSRNPQPANPGAKIKSMTEETKYLPGLKLREITLKVPLNHLEPEGRQIDIFARVATREDGEKKPYLVFFQGGPGSEDPRPSLYPDTNPNWLERVLQDYQVVLLDQRGTGRSTPVYATTDRGALAGLDPQGQAEYLSHLRADEIVNDAEAVRQYLGVQQWVSMGQSFGGFTTLRYLSAYPESLAGAIITGGLTAVGHPIEDIYAATWQIMLEKTEAYYRQFPGDRKKVAQVAQLCAAGKLRLPSGEALSLARWRNIGSRLGAQGGDLWLHNLLDHEALSAVFSHDLADALPFTGRNPIYSVLHESCYADGVSTRWAAQRTMPAAVRDDPTRFAGEHISHAIFTEDRELANLAAAADILATHEWPKLYQPENLKAAQVPVAAVAYFHDAFVPLEYSLETAALLPQCRLWVTSEYEHNGLRRDTRVIDRLIKLLQGKITQ